MCADDEREAIATPDHRRAHLTFEGVHKTGTIMLWDRGVWEPLPEFRDIQASLRQGKMRFVIVGERLKGSWTLTRKIKFGGSPEREVWTLQKDPDSFASSFSKPSVVDIYPNSVVGNQTRAEIEEAWRTPKTRRLGQQAFGF